MTDLSQMKEDWTEFYEILQISLQKRTVWIKILREKKNSPFLFPLPSPTTNNTRFQLTSSSQASSNTSAASTATWLSVSYNC